MNQKKGYLRYYAEKKKNFLNEITTNQYNQLDHIIAEKSLEKQLYTTSFFNFISDHKTITARIAFDRNAFTKQFLGRINVTYEKPTITSTNAIVGRKRKSEDQDIYENQKKSSKRIHKISEGRGPENSEVQSFQRRIVNTDSTFYYILLMILYHLIPRLLEYY